MTQDRRITDKLPGHPLQWDDSASPSAAPAAGQAGLAKYVAVLKKHWNGAWWAAVTCTEAEEINAAFFNLAAPVAADTEQGAIDTPEFEELMEKFANWQDDETYNEVVAHIDSVKRAPLATPADAGAGPILPGALTDAVLKFQKADAEFGAVPGNALGSTQHLEAAQQYQQASRNLIDAALSARLSTSGAPVTASKQQEIDRIAAYWKDQARRGCVDAFECALREAWDVAHQSPAPVTAEPAQSIHENEEVRQAVAEGLRGLWGCGRVWSAWNVGTMGEDDFYAADESDECIDQMIHAIAFLIAPAPADRDAIRPLYTCKGKGGLYELMGVAYGAGTSRGATVNLYREKATGVMYYRTPADFQERMERAADAAETRDVKGGDDADR